MPMDYGQMIGAHHISGRRWDPRLEVSQDNVGQVPPEELTVDPYLPVLGTDPYDPAGGIVIPRGRFVSIGNNLITGAAKPAYTLSGKTPLTLHDGKALTPVGFSVNTMFQSMGVGNFGLHDSNTVKFRKSFVAEVPYVLSINDAHGAIKPGDKVTGYWGSTTSLTNVAFLHRGKPVKWNPRLVSHATSAASAVIALAATYPGITPRLLRVFNATTGVTFTQSNVVWDTNLSKWTFSGTAATEVLYDYGQDADQIGGEVLRIQSITDLLDRDDYLKWVEYAASDRMNFPPLQPAATRYPVTTVTDESVSMSDNVGTLAYYPVSVHHPVTVEFKGTIVDKDTGAATTYSSSWYTMPTGPQADMRGNFFGLYHRLNWRTGRLEFFSNVTDVTSVQVTYSYITDPRDGAALWGGGVIGLTDGANLGAGKAGTPTHLDIPDCVGALRLIVA